MPLNIMAFFREWLGKFSKSSGKAPAKVVLKGAPHKLDHKVKALQKLFDQLDTAIGVFRRKIEIACPVRCGHCCENSRVETTELEMLPLAAHLVRFGEVERFYEAADKLDFEGRCVFYEPDAGHPGRGRCLRYELRPLICRLFAFSGNADKQGRPRLIVCGIIKDADPGRAQKAVEMVEKGAVRPPIMAEYVMKASTIDPEMAREHLPINLAFKRAVDRVWLDQQFRR